MQFGITFAMEAVPGGWFSAEAAYAWFDPDIQGIEAVNVVSDTGDSGISLTIGIGL